MNVLVVEDVIPNQIVLKKILERLEFKVDVAANGKVGSKKCLQTSKRNAMG